MNCSWGTASTRLVAVGVRYDCVDELPIGRGIDFNGWRRLALWWLVYDCVDELLIGPQLAAKNSESSGWRRRTASRLALRWLVYMHIVNQHKNM